MERFLALLLILLLEVINDVSSASFIINPIELRGENVSPELQKQNNLEYDDGHGLYPSIISSHKEDYESDIDEEEISRDYSISTFFRNFLPGNAIGNNSESDLSPNVNAVPSVPENITKSAHSMRNDLSNFLARLLENVKIDRNSLFRVQFYNTNFSRLESSANYVNNNGTDNYTLTAPNAVFGSPLCFGLCLTGQVYSDNGSIRILSDKRYSLFGDKHKTTPTTTTTSSLFTGGSSSRNDNINVIVELENSTYSSSVIEESNSGYRSQSTSAPASSSVDKVLNWIRLPVGWIYNNTPSINQLSSSVPPGSFQPLGISNDVIGIPNFLG